VSWCDCSADEASTADDEGDNVDEELSDDWSVTRSSRWTATRRSDRRKQRSTRMNNFGMLFCCKMMGTATMSRPKSCGVLYLERVSGSLCSE